MLCTSVSRAEGSVDSRAQSWRSNHRVVTQVQLRESTLTAVLSLTPDKTEQTEREVTRRGHDKGINCLLWIITGMSLIQSTQIMPAWQTLSKAPGLSCYLIVKVKAVFDISRGRT